MVQWLKLLASNAGVTGSIPGQGTKIPHATLRGRKKNRRRQEKSGQQETKKDSNEPKTVINMVDTNPTISIITLNVNGLNIPIKKQRL